MTETSHHQGTFTETKQGRNKRITEYIAGTIFLLMALLMIAPLLMIVGYLLYKAAPVLSIDFLISK